MSKLSFRARALDASKPMPIFMAEELPDLPDYSAINRAVPQMPSGMQKEEECEHHLQRAICAGLIIPTPEVSDLPNSEFYDDVYPASYKQPRQLIHMQPFTMEQDIPDYDMDSDDERWLQSQTQKLDLSPVKFEEMMDRLEKSSGQTVVSINEAKALLKEDDDLIIAVFDYWLNKRLKMQHPLILTVKTEHRAGTAANNPYLAFRRRTEKMQTRKNRKNDEASYEKMLKLRRDLHRAVTLLELVKRREKIKREHVHLTIEVFEKRYQAKDFSGAIMAEASAIKSSRPAFTPIFHNNYPNQSWSNKAALKDEVIPRREKRSYKKRSKHKALSHGLSAGALGLDSVGALSSDEEAMLPQMSPEPEEAEDEGHFAFRRNKLCSYHMPLPEEGNWSWCSREENGLADPRFRFSLTSVLHPRRRCVGFARRRVGRGGRVILDRASSDYDDYWRHLDFSIVEPSSIKAEDEAAAAATLPPLKAEPSASRVKVEVKREVEEEGVEPLEAATAPDRLDDKDVDMDDFLQSVRRNLLHFRPKTPPCEASSAPSGGSSPSFPWDECGASFSLEIQPLEAPSAHLLDTSPFLTDPFVFDLDVPVTDTRQRRNNNGPFSVGGETIDNSSDASNKVRDAKTTNDHDYVEEEEEEEGEEEVGGDDAATAHTIGCSRFSLSDVNPSNRRLINSSHRYRSTTRQRSNRVAATSHPPPATLSSSFSSSTLTSPKLLITNTNSVVNTGSNSYGGALAATATPHDGGNSANGLLATAPPYGFDVSSNRTRNNKLYAYSGGVGYPNATPTSTLSLHTASHTLTLNSHSANILEIPLAADADSVGGNSVQCTEAGGGAAVATPNSKQKIQGRKNNLIMEVT
ncbi:unnamed protein product [Brassicogethes aeneus]|uniref:Enhancer of polycomb-like protein n=1 Tax=Brassicogethes aeneus TaxID=1431903 RepID=A0A9P0AWH7_BRAAE|nr:unnamed protein product [Brassicogethes aeneus]